MPGKLIGESKDFFDQLQTFSDRYVALAGCESASSPWGYPGYKGGKPKGAILHFTADEDLHRNLRWFLREKFQSKSSSQVVIADRKMPKHDEFSTDLPLVAALPVTVVQCRKPSEGAWHATWTNRLCYGIENVCAGELRQDGGDFFTWRPRDQTAPKWTSPWESDKSPIPMCDRWWSPYPAAQIEANVIVLRYVQQMFQSLEPAWIVGHENVQGKQTNPSRPRDKRDPGPTFPTWGIREAALNLDDLENYSWWHEYTADPLYGQSYRDGLVIEWAKEQAEGKPQPSPDVAWRRFSVAIRAFPEELDRLLLETTLALLGYDREHRRESVYLFQKLMGLESDGVPGEKTRTAMVERLIDRGFLSEPTA